MQPLSSYQRTLRFDYHSKRFIESILLKRFLFLFTVLVLSSCRENSELTRQRAQIGKLEFENLALRDSIQVLTMSDSHIYNRGVSQFQEGHYFESQRIFEEFIMRFPTSSLKNSAQNMVFKCTAQEKATLYALINEVKKLDTQAAIARLEEYANGQHSDSSIKVVNSLLVPLRNEFARNIHVYEVESIVGVRLESIKTEWDWNAGLLTPKLSCNVKNISSDDIHELNIKVVFLDSIKKEDYGTSTEYLIKATDAALRPGFTRLASFQGKIGYTNDVAAFKLPNVVGEIYVTKCVYNSRYNMNDLSWHYYNTVEIEKSYMGRKWKL